MQNYPGVFLVIEGADGSGKSTQFKLLHERLARAGYDVEVFKFPQYEHPSSHFIRQYLNGEYGPATEISPYTASLFYALDRLEAAPRIKQALKAGKVVLSDRYVGSNMAHQGSKLADQAEQRGFFIWNDSLEFQLLDIPRPSLNIFLYMPVEISQQLLLKESRADRSYTTKQHDEHEKDVDHLKKTVETYKTLHQLFPKDFHMLDSTRNGKLLSIPEINDKIWQVIKPLLSDLPRAPRREPLKKIDLPIEPKTQSKPAISPPPKELESIYNISLLALSYLEASGAEINYKPPWTDKNQAGFYTPSELNDKLSKDYVTAIHKIRDTYFEVEEKLKQYLRQHPKASKRDAKDLSLPLIPLSATVKIEVIPDEQNIRSVIETFRTHSLAELRNLASELQKIAKNMPVTDDQQVSTSEQPELVADTIARIAQSRLPQTFSTSLEELQIMHTWPRNEFELIGDGLYPHTALSRSNILTELESWTYEQKKQALFSILNQADATILDEAKYRIDAITERWTLQAMIQDGLISEIKMQLPTPRYGYEVPTIIDEAALDDPFLDCFDESLSLYSNLQAVGDDEAGYGVLLGHKVRAQFTISANTLAKAGQNRPATYHQFIRRIKEKAAEVHPLIGEFLINPPRIAKPAGPKATEKPVTYKKKRSRRSK